MPEGHRGISGRTSPPQSGRTKSHQGQRAEQQYGQRAGFRDEQLDGTWQPFAPVGCDICKNTGYKGRVGIYQVMPISDEMERIIMTNGTSIDIADAAQRDGIKDLRQSGLKKVKDGLTSLEEINRVTVE